MDKRSSAKLEVQLILDGCKKIGITHVVLSPGSRNAPLSIAFDEDAAFQTFVVPDERCAAFYALGMAQQLNQPVAISCTSGSAPLNYFPAIAEAYYQGVPIVVISADRPEELVDQGDGQTIVQRNVYGQHVLAEAQLNPIHTKEQRWFFERKLTEVLHASIGIKQGPVHLNVPFSEPLYEITESIAQLNQWIQPAEHVVSLSKQSQTELIDLWKNSKKRMILVGQQNSDSDLTQLLEKLVEEQDVVVLTEHTSNTYSSKFVTCIDRTLNQFLESESELFQPDLLITIGSTIISKRIKTFLRATKNLKTIRIAADFPWMDTYQSLVYTTHVKATEVVELFKNQGRNGGQHNFNSTWTQANDLATKNHDLQLELTPFSDLKVMHDLMQNLPENAHVHISNSSIIRYALLMEQSDKLTYWSNRGTSGIDGSSSTAVGAAIANPTELHVLLTGDMSFFYDSNAFWYNQLPANLRVVIINNGGGDIFNIIPGPASTPQRGKYFVAEHSFKGEYLCKTFGMDYQAVVDLSELKHAISSFFNWKVEGRIQALEIDTTKVANSDILKEYFKTTSSK